MAYADIEKRKATRQAYYQKNLEKMQEESRIQRTKYRELNKDKLNQKFECECGGSYAHKHKSQHMATAKHQKYIKQ